MVFNRTGLAVLAALATAAAHGQGGDDTVPGERLAPCECPADPRTGEVVAPCQCPAEDERIREGRAMPEPGFAGEGALGWIVNNGNTNNEALNGNLTLRFAHQAWRHTGTVSAKRVSEGEEVTAERYLLTGKSDYNYGETGYAFVAGRYDDDRFSGYEYQASVSSGMGWRLINRDGHHLDVEVGVGYRRNRLRATDEVEQNNISRIAQHYDVRLSETTLLSQDLLVESGETSTVTEVDVSLKVTVNDNVALQLGYSVKRNSNPPGADDPVNPTRNTDSTSRVTLVYGF